MNAGLRAVAELRLKGAKPRAVHVAIVSEAWAKTVKEWFGLPIDWTGLVYVDIGPADSLADMDFRPLVGLSVTVIDMADDPARYRRVCALVAAAKPEKLTAFTATEQGDVMHVLEGETTERIPLWV